MTTVVSPSSSPTPVYNRSGVTVVSVTAGAQSGEQPVGNDGTPIPQYSGVTVALVTTANTAPNGSSVVLLPSGAEIGDVVEVYLFSTTDPNQPVQINLFPPVGESVGILPTSTGTNSSSNAPVQAGQGRIYRKVSSSNWQGTTGGGGAGN
jgi:hypothetical protein